MGGPATHIELYGGTGSGKTFLILRAIVIRALAAPGSRHAILRFRFQHAKLYIGMQTFPALMRACWPDVGYNLDRQNWIIKLPGDSEVWIGGLDDKERTDKILGSEYATLFLNEVSQVPYSSVLVSHTRLRQQVLCSDGKPLRLKAYYDLNPTTKKHWSNLLFRLKVSPIDKSPLSNPEDYACMQLNPDDNEKHLGAGYIESLKHLPKRQRTRFYAGEYGDDTENALWTPELIEKHHVTELPAMQRIVVGVDPSGADDGEEGHDDIGIVVCGLGTDGLGYVLADYTLNAGPATWGRRAVKAYTDHEADRIVGEENYGGAMVKYTVQSQGDGHFIPYRSVKASRGKVVRAEPIAALTEDGKIKFHGDLSSLEDELCAFTTTGYIGGGSPNRADAMIWALTDLFPGMVRGNAGLFRPEDVFSAPLASSASGHFPGLSDDEPL